MQGVGSRILTRCNIPIYISYHLRACARPLVLEGFYALKYFIKKFLLPERSLWTSSPQEEQRTVVSFWVFKDPHTVQC